MDAKVFFRLLRVNQTMPHNEDHLANGETSAFGPNSLNAVFAPSLLDPDLEIPDGITGPQGNKSVKRFSVYRNNVVVSLMDALKDTYPSIHAILGENNFDLVARRFVADNPPVSPMMQHYGAGFDRFLQTLPRLKTAPFLPQLARLERSWLDAYHAVDDPVVAAEELGSVPEEIIPEIRFTTHSAAQVFRSTFPLFALFCRRSDPSGDIDLTQTQNVLLTRPALEVEVHEISKGQAVFFENILSGHALGEALQSAADGDAEFDPANAITMLLQSGCCSTIIMPGQ